MQSIDHLNLNKPERERGLKKVVELYWKKRRRQKWGKKVPLFYSSHQYWISLRSITLKSQPHHIGHLASYVCIQIQGISYISFSADVVLGETVSNLFCWSAPQPLQYFKFRRYKLHVNLFNIIFCVYSAYLIIKQTQLI